MRRTLRLACSLIRHLGPGWLVFRLRYAWRLRSGALKRRTPVQPWAAIAPESWLAIPALAAPDAFAQFRRAHAPAFFFQPDDRPAFAPLLARWQEGSPFAAVATADAILLGRFPFFRDRTVEAGFPPHWHRNPAGRETLPHLAHWSESPDFGEIDIKLVWELNRFAWVYDLVRAYWTTMDNKYAEAFWLLLEDWRLHNPPNQGVNWKCGQETAFRSMALCVALYGFIRAPASTGPRLLALAQTLAANGARIAANIDYAVRQQNNHGISEALGLWTLGMLFPEFRDAPAWAAQGRDLLERQGLDLIDDDGGFSQYSANYHRLMLHDYLWALRLGDILNAPFSAALRRRVALAADFLFQAQDATQAGLPNFGNSDGSLILPFNGCPYHDYRPVLQATQFLVHGHRAYPPGPWDEDLLWLFGIRALAGTPDRPALHPLSAPRAGCHSLRDAHSMAFLRAGNFHHRPAEADLLHVDLWYQGIPIACDPGTFTYHAPPPWNNSLAATRVHNTIAINGLDQMDRAGRFLWLPWATSRVTHRRLEPLAHLAYLEATHNGYTRLRPPATHRRAIVQLGADAWLVLDRIDAASPHAARLHWLLADYPASGDPASGRLVLQTPAGTFHVAIGTLSGPVACSLVRADPASTRGWQAPAYYRKVPALSLAAEAHAATVTFWTVLSPEPIAVTASTSGLRIGLGPRRTVDLRTGTGSGAPLVARVEHGEGAQYMEIA